MSISLKLDTAAFDRLIGDEPVERVLMKTWAGMRVRDLRRDEKKTEAARAAKA